MIDVPEGDPLPAFCTPVADDTPTSDWAFTDSDTAKVPEANNHTEE